MMKQIIYKATYSYQEEVMDPKDFTITKQESKLERSFVDYINAQTWLMSFANYEEQGQIVKEYI